VQRVVVWQHNSGAAAPLTPSTPTPPQRKTHNTLAGPDAGQQALAAVEGKQAALRRLQAANAQALAALLQEALGYLADLDAMHALLQQLVGVCMLQEQPKLDQVCRVRACVCVCVCVRVPCCCVGSCCVRHVTSAAAHSQHQLRAHARVTHAGRAAAEGGKPAAAQQVRQRWGS
jgi:hypothetical protein